MLCFRKIAVPKKFLDQRGVGGCQEFLSKNFWVGAPKNFMDEPFCAVFQKNCGSEKVYGSEGRRRVSRISVDFFCRTVPTKSVRQPFCAAVHKYSASLKNYR